MANEMQRKTFLSYSRLNKDFAIKLAKELKSEGFDVWLDTLDIPLGSRWDREVERALKESEIFMIILTPDSVDSENVLDEIGYAIDTHKRILPILLEDCEMPLRLRRLQYVDFTKKSFDEGVDAAKTLLRGLIDQPTIPRGKTVTEQKAEEEQAAKTEADRKAKEEAGRLAKQKMEEERLAKQKADDERIAKAKADKERKAKEEAIRLAKAEADRKTKEEADRLAAQKVEEDRIAKQKAEEERLAKVKAESDRKAKEEADHGAEEKATPVILTSTESVSETTSTSTASTIQKKLIPQGLVIGFIAVVVLIIAGIALSNRTSTTEERTSSPTNTAKSLVVQPTQTQKISPSLTPKPPSTPKPTPTPIPLPAILDASKAKELMDNSIPVSAYSLAVEQSSSKSVEDLWNSEQPIPVTIEVSSGPVHFSLAWCAKTQDILENNIAHMEFSATFNEKIVPDTQVYRYYLEIGGQFCHDTELLVDDWIKGEYIIMVENVRLQKINDGFEDFDPGKFTVQYVVTVP